MIDGAVRPSLGTGRGSISEKARVMRINQIIATTTARIVLMGYGDENRHKVTGG
jgi:hypothetical protein